MTPEVIWPLARVRQREVEVLQLREGEQDRCLYNVDAEFILKRRVIKVKGVLKSQLATRISLLHASVFDDIDLLGRPACRDIRDDGLQQHWP
ncbi:hypothetical protein RRF57_011627 [Xylaria bambusicola]|uniref:Uncharacterized protein n=1 Tax=Xylaria bambusicola TaxID=326684 RepID=A0AAN7Z3V5_9PEZI